jgi:hypothetical protein
MREHQCSVSEKLPMASSSIVATDAARKLNSWPPIKRWLPTTQSHIPKRTNAQSLLLPWRKLRGRASGSNAYDEARGSPQALKDRALPVLRRRQQFQSHDWAGRSRDLVHVHSMRTSDRADRSDFSVHMRKMLRPQPEGFSETFPLYSLRVTGTRVSGLGSGHQGSGPGANAL